MNARFVAGLAVAAIPIMSLLGAASASADTTIEGKYHSTVEVVHARCAGLDIPGSSAGAAGAGVGQ